MYLSFNVSSVKGGNTGSCFSLANYLDKEQKNNWFSHTQYDINTEEVVSEIDRYGKGQLKKEQWKFIEIEYNPSQDEQLEIIKKATGRNDIKVWNDLTKEEQEQTKKELIAYARKSQNVQAILFNRDSIKSGEDLKYYGKVETERRYKGYDDEVKKGLVKQGQLKPGLNMHIHIVQSRKAMNKKTVISPVTKHKNRSKKNKIGQGFNRNLFYNTIEKEFDLMFNYNRPKEQTFEYLKAKKYNRIEIEEKTNSIKNEDILKNISKENLENNRYRISRKEQEENKKGSVKIEKNINKNNHLEQEERNIKKRSRKR